MKGKYKVMNIGKGITDNYDYKLGEGHMEEVSTMTDLCVLVDNKLTWSDHVTSMMRDF